MRKPDEIRKNVPLTKITFSYQHRPRGRFVGSAKEDIAIKKCAEAIKKGTVLPPIRVVEIGNELLCFDGFIRKSAYMDVSPKSKVTCEIYKGNWQDFLIFTGEVNRDPDPYGIQRTEDDIKKVVHNIFDDKDLSEASSEQISKWTGCDLGYINHYRTPISGTVIPLQVMDTKSKTATIKKPICPLCNNPLAKNGVRGTKSGKRQLWRCNNCGYSACLPQVET